MADDPNLSELLDDDKLPAEYPPHEPTGVLDDELTVRGQQTDEPLEERIEREEPDLPLPVPGEDRPVGRLVDPDEGGPDRTAQSVASDVDEGWSQDRLEVADLADGGPAAGDTTTRDVATERVEELSAEEAAVHLTDDPPMGDGDGYV
jgi:hypothetical protein